MLTSIANTSKCLINFYTFIRKLLNPHTHNSSNQTRLPFFHSIHISHLKLFPQTYHLLNTQETIYFCIYYFEKKLKNWYPFRGWSCCSVPGAAVAANLREKQTERLRNAKSHKKKTRKKSKNLKKKRRRRRGVRSANWTSWGNQQTQVSKAKCVDNSRLG